MPSATSIVSKSQWLSGNDLPQGKRFFAYIHSATVEVVGQPGEDKLIVDLVDKQGRPWPKRLIMNMTNVNNLKPTYSDDYTVWGGCAVELYTEMTRNPRTLQMGPGVRIAPVQDPKRLPANGAAPSASTAVGMPAIASDAPIWTPPRQPQHQVTDEMPPLEDDTIPF